MENCHVVAQCLVILLCHILCVFREITYKIDYKIKHSSRTKKDTLPLHLMYIFFMV